jgi:pyruvate dehydrogenase E2 component (dihydrolipoamide acetyltransferase)
VTDLPAAETTTSNLKGVVEAIEPDRPEQAIARRSAEVRAVVPTAEFTVDVDMDAALAGTDPAECEPLALLIAAVAQALRAVPRVNGSYRDARYELYSRINVGVTLVQEGVHMTPTLFDVDQLSAAEITTELAGLYGRARAGELHPSEMAGATFTVIDGLDHTAAALSPLITAPQAGVLAAGPLRDAPVVRQGRIVPARTLTLTLAVDQRIVHAAHATAFLEEIKRDLEEAA